jgi:hypothetical protein
MTPEQRLELAGLFLAAWLAATLAVVISYVGGGVCQ